MQSKYRQDFAVLKNYGASGLQKLVYFKVPVRQESSGKKAAAVSSDAEKLENNIIRARTTVQELALCNEWQLFGTFTLDKEKYDRRDLSSFRADFGQFLRDCRKKWGGDWKYLLIPEKHKDGAWHMHGLFGGVPSSALRAFTLDENIPERMKTQIRTGTALFDFPAYRRKFGWVSLSLIRDKVACSRYITKYISKDLAARKDELHAHLFYASQGLARAEVVYKGNVLLKECDFENDFVKILWSNGENFRDVVYLD